MAGIAKQDGVVEAPGRNLVHIEQLPDPEAFWVSHLDKSNCARVELLVDVQNCFEGGFLVVCCGRSQFRDIRGAGVAW